MEHLLEFNGWLISAYGQRGYVAYEVGRNLSHFVVDIGGPSVNKITQCCHERRLLHTFTIQRRQMMNFDEVRMGEGSEQPWTAWFQYPHKGHRFLIHFAMFEPTDAVRLKLMLDR